MSHDQGRSPRLPRLTGRALVLFSGVDKRLLFAIPRAGLILDRHDRHRLHRRPRPRVPTGRRRLPAAVGRARLSVAPSGRRASHDRRASRALVQRAAANPRCAHAPHRLRSPGRAAGSDLGSRRQDHRLPRNRGGGHRRRLRPPRRADRQVDGRTTTASCQPAGGHQGAAAAALPPLADLGSRLATSSRWRPARRSSARRFRRVTRTSAHKWRWPCARSIGPPLGLHAPPHAARRDRGSGLGRRPACRGADARRSSGGPLSAKRRAR